MSVCAKTLLLWDIQPKQNLAPGDACPSPAGGSPGHPAGRTGCTGGCDTQHGPGCTHREKRLMKLENWGPRIRNLLMDEEALLVLCIRCWGEAPPEKQFLCYPKPSARDESHLSLFTWRGSVADWDPVWHMPGLPLFLTRVCVWCLCGAVPLPCAVPAQLCGPARAGAPPSRPGAAEVTLGLKSDRAV